MHNPSAADPGSPAQPQRPSCGGETIRLDRRRLFHGAGAAAALAITGNRLSAQAAGKASTRTEASTAPTAMRGKSAPQFTTTALVENAVTTFSPINYGAAGNGTTDDTIALQACVTAAVAAKGIVELGNCTFKTSSPINIVSNLHMRGSGSNSLSSGGGAIVNSTSDLFTIAAAAYNVTFEDCNLTSGPGGGHIWNATNGPSMSFWRILGCQLWQQNPAKSIWNQVGGSWIDCMVDLNCQLLCASARSDSGCGTTSGSTAVTDSHAVSGDAGLPIGNANLPAGTTIAAVRPGIGYTVSNAATGTASRQAFYIGGATVSPWHMSGLSGALNSVKFARMRCTGQYSYAVPFFKIDNGSVAGYSANIIFDSITFEVCGGGSIHMTGCYQVTVNQCAHWDAAPSASTFSFKQSAAGYPCRNITVRQSENLAPNALYPDIICGSTTSSTLLDSCGAWGTPATYSGPVGQTTIISPMVTNSGAPPVTSFPGPVAVNGATGATAGTRLAGATASGHPTTGTFLTGDVVPDQTGDIWICTAGGTPGSWAKAGAAAASVGDVQPQDIGLMGWTANPAMATAAAAYKASAYVGRLLFWTFKVQVSGNIRSINYSVDAGGIGMSNAHFGIYSMAGALLRQSAIDQSSNFASINAHSAALSSPVHVTAGLYRVGLVIGAMNGAPSFIAARSANAGTFANLGMTPANYMAGCYGELNEYKALPSSFTPSRATALAGLPILVMK
jgi:hypothetical protein